MDTSSQPIDPEAVKSDLLALFERHGLQVAVGLTPSGGVAIRSQDDRVDAENMGPVYAQEQL